MRLHILGISGTFMSGLALLAKAAGHIVSGSDEKIYPPMSTQLEAHGIPVFIGYQPAHLDPAVDLVIVGNVISRGNAAMEYILNERIPYTSGPDWLFQHILSKKRVLAVAGTHGKTTTASLLAWMLEASHLSPGFLIGGIPENFGVSARLTDSPYFVIEADEYDSAFFDKRSKFMHYHPEILILNNLEFDHADIFPDLSAIIQQFRFLVRTVPSRGTLVVNDLDQHLKTVLAGGAWSRLVTFGSSTSDWRANLLKADGSAFTVFHEGAPIGEASSPLLGEHNVMNTLASLAACAALPCSPSVALAALSTFKNVKRRLEIKSVANGVTIYDDFAHHPTAIEKTLAGLRAKLGKETRLIAVLEFGSYTMRAGCHQAALKEALVAADAVFCKAPAIDWGIERIAQTFAQPAFVFKEIEALIASLLKTLKTGDHVVVMSNTHFDDIHERLAAALKS